MELTNLFNQNQVGTYIDDNDLHLFNNATPLQLSNLQLVNELYTPFLINQCGLTDDYDFLGALSCTLLPILNCPNINILGFQPVMSPINYVSINNYFIKGTEQDIKHFAHLLMDASDYSIEIYLKPLNLNKTTWHLVTYCLG